MFRSEFWSVYLAGVVITVVGFVLVSMFYGCSISTTSKITATLSTLTTVAEYTNTVLKSSKLPGDKKTEITKDLDAGIDLIAIAVENLQSGGERRTTLELARTAACYISKAISALDVLLPGGLPPYVHATLNSVIAVVGQCEIL